MSAWQTPGLGVSCKRFGSHLTGTFYYMVTHANESRSKAARILVVDDDVGQRSLLGSFLESQGFTIVTAESGEEAIEKLAGEDFHLLISDVRMPGMSGLELFKTVRETSATLPVLLVTAYADVRDAVAAVRDGVANYLEKPIDLDELLATVNQFINTGEDSQVVAVDGIALPDSVIVQSASMQRVVQDAALIAPSESRVLITGESGVGKEVIADLIHRWSPRADGPLVKVNCAAIPEALLESELFGHEKGAFTDATSQRIGRFEQADGGTILLDEVAEMSPLLQAKLLRVSQDGTFQRVGSNDERKTDARILAATNRNLEQEVIAGRFREDLFFRLSVIEIYVPPLRERQADILALANLFAAQFTKGNPRFSNAAMSSLEFYEWPGNVRELHNAIERATLMSRGEVILPEHLPKRVQDAAPDSGGDSTPGAPGKRMEDVERVVILQALRENAYNRTETARSLGISRRALTYKLRRFREQGHTIDEA